MLEEKFLIWKFDRGNKTVLRAYPNSHIKAKLVFDKQRYFH